MYQAPARYRDLATVLLVVTTLIIAQSVVHYVTVNLTVYICMYLWLIPMSALVLHRSIWSLKWEVNRPAAQTVQPPKPKRVKPLCPPAGMRSCQGRIVVHRNGELECQGGRLECWPNIKKTEQFTHAESVSCDRFNHGCGLCSTVGHREG